MLALLSSYVIAVRNPFEYSFSELDLLGVGAVLISCCCWALAGVLSRSMVLKEKGHRELMLVRSSYATLCCALWLIFGSGAFEIRFIPDWYLVPIIIVSGGVITPFAYYSYYKGLSYITANVAGFIMLLIPLVSIPLGVLFLGETFSIYQAVATAALLFAVARLSAQIETYQ